MNLGQAAAVCLYELVHREEGAVELEHPPAPSNAALSEELDRFTELLNELLDASGYHHRHPAGKDAASLRRLVRRMRFQQADAATWMGILRQALWKIRRNDTSS